MHHPLNIDQIGSAVQPAAVLGDLSTKRGVSAIDRIGRNGGKLSAIFAVWPGPDLLQRKIQPSEMGTSGVEKWAGRN